TAQAMPASTPAASPRCIKPNVKGSRSQSICCAPLAPVFLRSALRPDPVTRRPCEPCEGGLVFAVRAQPEAVGLRNSLRRQHVVDRAVAHDAPVEKDR